LTIAVDAMGGDHAPRVNVEGAVAAAIDFGLDTLLVGRRREVESELAKTGYTGGRVGVVDAEEVVLFDEPSITPIRKKRRARARCGGGSWSGAATRRAPRSSCKRR